MIKTYIRHYRAWFSAVRQQALAEAYAPIVRGFLLPGSLYYLFVTWGHWKDESGAAFLTLGGLSFFTAILYELFRRTLTRRRNITIGRLEAAGFATNLLMYCNVLSYMLLHFHEEKLVYFVLMAVIFSTSGITLRTTLSSVSVSIGTMLILAYQHTTPDRFHQFAFIGVATSFTAMTMATLLRKAILRQIDARLAADRMAYLDSLTGIPNRRSVFNRMEELEREETPFWLGILDLDGFKSINDIYGHAVGDALLCDVVERLQSHCSADVTVGRIGGDEFALILTGDASCQRAETIGAAIIESVSQPYRVSLLQLNVSGTIGFAHYPSMGVTTREIYEKADFALYRGKQNMRGQPIVFTLNEDKEMREGLAFEKGLREADLEQELYLLFQPQMDVQQNRVVGFEALARWQSPSLGPVRPDQFIRAAERAGLIQNLTKILFGKALDTLVGWPEDVGMSFNLSAQDVADRTFIFSLVSEVLQRGIAPSRVEFEITETAVMKDIGAARSLLQDLKDAGFRIALDDFGSGYSSFEYLDQLPLNKVKVDKSFVRRVAQSAASREIVAGVITLCRNLDLDCVLEGVETEEDMEILKPLSPRIIQGYLFGRPMNEHCARDMLTPEKTARRAS